MSLKVEEILISKGIRYAVPKLAQVAFTVEDVVNFSEGQVNPEEICKTIILRGKKTGKKIAVMLRGNDKVDFAAVKKIFAEEMSIASAEEVKEAAGVEPGAVCPFLLNVPLYVDENVLKLKRINCGSGDHLYGLEFEIDDLAKGVSYQVANLAKTIYVK